MGNQKDGGIEYIPDTRDHRLGVQKMYGCSVGDPFYEVHQYIGTDHPYWWIVCLLLPYVHSGILPANLNTSCRWSERSAKKNILSIARVFTFEAIPKFWGMEYWRKWCKERTCWTISKAYPVGVDAMARCSFSINFCT